MVINTNTAAQTAANNLQGSQVLLSRSLARLSSGSKLINPSDDAAGMAVSARMDAQIQRIDAARANVGNAVSFTQTQDGYLKKIARAFDRMSELSILAQDATKTDSDRALYNTEYQALSSYILNTSTKEFNGVSLFDNSVKDVTIDSDGNKFTMNGVDLSGTSYTDASSSSITTVALAGTALSNIKIAINKLADDRATLGAYQARLNYTSEELMISKENLTAASSRIKDVDVADESTQYAKFNILVQSGTAMLTQANQMPQSVLRLLQ